MKRVLTTELKAGMTLARTIINDNLIVILAENTLLSEAHITRLKFLGIESIYIKDAYDLSPQQTIVQAMLNHSYSFVSKYQEVVILAEDIFSATIKNKQIPIKKTHALLQKSFKPLVKNSGVIDYLYELKNSSNSIYNHSIRVAILAGVIAKWLRYDDSKIKDIILAGFLHDIGKTQIEQKVIEKNIENLTPMEYEIYVQHTIEGYNLLHGKQDISDGVKNAALQHHERCDGSGFPFSCHNDEIHDYAKIVAIADLYDTITTEREGFLKQTPFSAIERISKDMFTSLDPKFCVPFLNNIQQSFIGSKVLLSNNKYGRIIQYPKGFTTQPIIKIDDETIIDLNTEHTLKIIEYNPS